MSESEFGIIGPTGVRGPDGFVYPLAVPGHPSESTRKAAECALARLDAAQAKTDKYQSLPWWKRLWHTDPDA